MNLGASQWEVLLLDTIVVVFGVDEGYLSC